MCTYAYIGNTVPILAFSNTKHYSFTRTMLRISSSFYDPVFDKVQPVLEAVCVYQVTSSHRDDRLLFVSHAAGCWDQGTEENL